MDICLFFEVHGSLVLGRRVGDAEEVRDVAGEGSSPLATKGGDAGGENFDVRRGELWIVMEL